MPDKTSNFWSSLPGVLTGLAAVITAVTGLYLSMKGEQPPAAQETKQVSITPSGSTSDQASSQTTIGSGAQKPISLKELSVPQTHIAKPESAHNEKTPFPETGPLVDCTQFPTVNTVESLMSWSDYYHKQILTADGRKGRALDPCNKTIDYRGMAHCKAPTDPTIRLALLETLTLCRIAGIEWEDIEHTIIISDR